MRYSTPIRLYKYLQYYWAGANAKGHGVHSPFVFQFIQDLLNATSSLEAITYKVPVVQKILLEIEAASASSIVPKIKLVIARILQRAAPSNIFVTGALKQFKEAESIKAIEFAAIDQSVESEESIESVDFVFIGEGQSYQALLETANCLIDKMHSNSWMILHGIHEDASMEAAWKVLKKHAKIRLTIDLFAIGILFCRKEQKEQEHFIIRY